MSSFEHPRLDGINLTEVLAALGDPIRLEVVTILAKHDAEVGWSEFAFDINKATLSYHLKTLRMAGLIQHRKEGTRCFISLRRDLDEVFPGLLQAILMASAKTVPNIEGPSA